MRRGLYIAFEGINGCGKSSQTWKARQYLNELGIPCHRTRQIGGSAYGGALRQIMENESLRPQDGMAKTLAMASDRAENTAQVKKHLAEGKWVVSDRSELTMLVYQEHEGMNPDILDLVNTLCAHVSPDVTFFIDVDPSLALERTAKRDGANFKFSSPESLEQAQLLRGLYIQHWLFNKRILYVPNPNRVWTEEGTFRFIKQHLDRIVREWQAGKYDGTIQKHGQQPKPEESTKQEWSLLTDEEWEAIANTHYGIETESESLV